MVAVGFLPCATHGKAFAVCKPVFTKSLCPVVPILEIAVWKCLCSWNADYEVIYNTINLSQYLVYPDAMLINFIYVGPNVEVKQGLGDFRDSNLLELQK